MGITLTNEEFQEKFYNKFDKNEYTLISQYISASDFIKIRHNCGYEFEKKPKNIMPEKEHLNCPKCFCNLYTDVIPGINDMATTNPELIPLLKDPEDAYRYKTNTNKKIYFICPVCGNEIYKSGNEVHKHGLQCKYCSDGFSYAEKFMKSILNQLKVDYIHQYNPDWARPYRYDFYFKVNNKEYIVEMDGGLGHGNFTLNGKQDIAGKQIDAKKDVLAKLHNIKVIRIDCNYIDIENRYDYIKEHILISEVAQILNLSKINFSLCRVVAEKSIFISVCDLVKQGMRSFVEIAKRLEISNSTVSRYLKIACESGYLNMDYKNLKKQSLALGYEKNKQRNENNPNGFNRIPVKCIETGEIFNSMDAADKKYGGCVSSYLSGRIKYTGHLDDGTVLHWERI